MSAHVAVLGLGAMGLPIATNLARHHEVRGFDLSRARLDEAAGAGVIPSTSAAEAVDGVEFVVVAVRDGAQLTSVLFDGAITGLAPGAVVVVTSTVGAEAVLAVRDRLATTGHHVVDAPVSGGPVRAGTGDLLIMAGADEPVLERSRSLLEDMASNLVIAGGVGDGQNMKVVNQLLCGIHTAAAAEALALAQALGLDLDQCVQVFGQGAAASFMLADRGPRMAQQLRNEEPPLRSRLDVIAKDMKLVADLTRGLGVPTPLAGAGDHAYRLAMLLGLQSQDDSIMAPLFAGQLTQKGKTC